MKIPAKFSIRIETCEYNWDLFGKPWIAQVDFSKSPKGEYRYGDWFDNRHYEKYTGGLSIDVEIGDIIAVGQQSFECSQSYNIEEKFFVVNNNGHITELGNKESAYKYYTENHKPRLDYILVKFEFSFD